MIEARSLGLRKIIQWTWRSWVILLLFSTTISCLYYFEVINFAIPWLPVSVVGTAVAFYAGFKNNQAYNRMWEARKIWGGIVNDSRAWGMMVDSFVSNLFREDKLSEEELQAIKKQLIHRHILWLYVHRLQLLKPTPWEHVSQSGRTARMAKNYQENFGVGLFEDKISKNDLKNLIPSEELVALKKYSNMATQLINQQSRDLAALRERDIIDDFRHIEMENVLRTFYAYQGKNERIKKFPLPRQYANVSRHFIMIFLGLFPFSLVPELLKDLPEIGLWLAIPITTVIGWIYITMEIVGDFTENPFQGMANDIPMMSLCRTIEIDLREMLGEDDLPPPITSENGILM